MGDHHNLGVTVTGHIAEIGLKVAKRSQLGFLVSPALWGVNYGVTGSEPSSLDVALWCLGFGGGMLSIGSLASSYVKALVDDDLQRKANVAVKMEPVAVRKNLHLLAGAMPPSVLAIKVAEQGGTAWQHPNGVWMSIVTRNKYMVPNYRPAAAIAVRRPVFPYQKNGRSFVITDKLSAPVASY